MAYEKVIGRPHPSIRKHRLLKVDESARHQRWPRATPPPPAPSSNGGRVEPALEVLHNKKISDFITILPNFGFNILLKIYNFAYFVKWFPASVSQENMLESKKPQFLPNH